MEELSKWDYSGMKATADKAHAEGLFNDDHYLLCSEKRGSPPVRLAVNLSGAERTVAGERIAAGSAVLLRSGPTTESS